MYFKITNESENHHKFQYETGLNILVEKFNDDPNESCCAGGFYFTDAKHILKFLDYGIYLREVILPTDNPDFKMIKDKDSDKYRANMIILSKRYDLADVATYKYLTENGADINVYAAYILRYNAGKGYLAVVKYLVENYNIGIDIALQDSARFGHLDIVKYLIDEDADVCVDDNLAFKLAVQNGHLDIVQYLIKCGVDIHADNNYALKWSADAGHLDMVKYLVKQGANIHVDNDLPLLWAAYRNRMDIVKFLIENGADIHAYNDCALCWAVGYGDLPMVKFLVEFGNGAGANIHPDNNYPLRICKRNGRTDIYEYLNSKKLIY
jgi:ankyrin repeat protein